MEIARPARDELFAVTRLADRLRTRRMRWSSSTRPDRPLSPAMEFAHKAASGYESSCASSSLPRDDTGRHSRPGTGDHTIVKRSNRRCNPSVLRSSS